MTLDGFRAEWGEALEARARLVLAEISLPENAATHCDIGDAIAISEGLKPITYNWELLDVEAAHTEPRSALGVIAGALESDMEFPKEAWLGPDGAVACAQDFLALLDPPRTLIANRIEDYWNPLSDARIEWAFVGFDAEWAVLMLVMRD